MSTDRAPALAILIVSYQTAADVRALMASLRAHPTTIASEVLILDNASPDGAGAELARDFADEADVRVLQLPANVGFGAANTHGATLTDAPYLLFLNPDCVIEANACDAACAYLAAHPEVGVVGLRVVREDGSLEPTARTFPDPWSGLAGRKSLLRKLWPGNPLSRRFMVADQASEGAAQVVDWVAGTAMLVRREEFLALGGFDPDYFLYWEDADLCKRYRDQRSLHTVYIAEGRIVHAGDGAAKTAKPFAIRQFHKAAYTYVCKHLAPSPWHPLRWFAYLALHARAALLSGRAGSSR